MFSPFQRVSVVLAEGTAGAMDEDDNLGCSWPEGQTGCQVQGRIEGCWACLSVLAMTAENVHLISVRKNKKYKCY